jgi:2-dehydro-3-deoxy-D-arabinonate dehydratase
LRRFFRVETSEGPRVAREEGDALIVLDHDDPLAAIGGAGEPCGLAAGALLAPVEAPEIWCAGVTYERSRDARLEESQTEARDVYALVYDADRPELFLKDAQMLRTVGPGGTIRVRGDSHWTVPEPELGVVIGEHEEPVAVTIGNDVSSRDIEGANPLYIPQAKIWAGSCAIGPALAVPDDWERPLSISLRIEDEDGAELFAGETSTEKMRRSALELMEWALRDNPIPAGSVLLTGTGLVPPDDYTLASGHTVRITIEGIGELTNTVAA